MTRPKAVFETNGREGSLYELVQVENASGIHVRTTLKRGWPQETETDVVRVGDHLADEDLDDVIGEIVVDGWEVKIRKVES